MTKHFIKSIRCVANIGAALLLASYAYASPKAPEAGFEYRVLSQKSAVNAPIPKNKVEVTEFFWYGCPHCYALEPHLAAWRKKNASKIIFKPIPVNFSQVGQLHQRVFYALEAMQRSDMHAKVFQAIHQKNQRLDTPEVLRAFAKDNGLDEKKFLEHMYSFSVAAQVQKANRLIQDYQIDGVPALLVQQKYFTSAELASGREEVLQVLDALVEKSLKENQ